MDIGMECGCGKPGFYVLECKTKLSAVWDCSIATGCFIVRSLNDIMKN